MKCFPLVLFLATTLLTAEEPPAFAIYTQTIPGSKVRFEMLPIPGGTFTMGSPAT